MKRDFNVVVCGFDGTPIEQPVHKVNEKGVHVVDEKGNMVFSHIETVKLKKFLFDLLGGRLKGDDNITGEQLMNRYAVAIKIKAAGEGPTELDDTDMKTLTEVLEKGASPLIYGMVKSILNTDPTKPALVSAA